VYQDEHGKQLGFQLAEKLRSQGISADLAFGSRALRKQLGAADRAGARYAIFVGEDAQAADTVELKDLRNGAEQRRIQVGELVSILGEARGSAE
jgi:histidyl-tRNA synthetase